jgi:glucans biosynthesis protein C
MIRSMNSQALNTDREHALDAVRAFALLLGIALHASLSLVPGIDLGLWPISDIQKDAGLGYLGFVIHIFRMATFFFVAGYLARVLLGRLGLQAFVRNRFHRIFLPLVVFWIICYVLIAAIVIWTIAKSHGGQLPREMPTWVVDAKLNFMHLWFLYILIWLYALALALRKALTVLGQSEQLRQFLDRHLHKLLNSSFGSLLLAIPIGIALSLIDNWDAKQGIPTPGYSLIPDVMPMLIYAYMFGLGWLLNRQRCLMNNLARSWPLNFILGLSAAMACLSILHPYSAQAAYLPLKEKWAYAACYSIALVCWTLALVGIGVKHLNQPSPKIRYLCDASYWMYIAHLPLIMALQTSVMFRSWHWALKYALINGLSVVLLIATYHFLSDQLG